MLGSVELVDYATSCTSTSFDISIVLHNIKLYGYKGRIDILIYQNWDFERIKPNKERRKRKVHLGPILEKEREKN